MKNPMGAFLVAFFVTALVLGFVAGQFAPRVVGPWGVLLLVLGVVGLWVLALIQSYKAYTQAMKLKEMMEKTKERIVEPE